MSKHKIHKLVYFVFICDLLLLRGKDSAKLFINIDSNQEKIAINKIFPKNKYTIKKSKYICIILKDKRR